MTKSNSDKERSEKRGILRTGHAQKLSEDADADAANDEGEE